MSDTPRPERRITDEQAMERLHALLDNCSWDSDTAEEVGEIVTLTGRGLTFDDVEHTEGYGPRYAAVVSEQEAGRG